jgi:hypothetical protein
MAADASKPIDGYLDCHFCLVAKPRPPGQNTLLPGFMLIRVVLGVNDFMFLAGFSEKRVSVGSGGEVSGARLAEAGGGGSSALAGLLNCVILPPGFPIEESSHWFLLFDQFSFKSRI